MVEFTVNVLAAAYPHARSALEGDSQLANHRIRGRVIYQTFGERIRIREVPLEQPGLTQVELKGRLIRRGQLTVGPDAPPEREGITAASGQRQRVDGGENKLRIVLAGQLKRSDGQIRRLTRRCRQQFADRAAQRGNEPVSS